MSRLAIATLAIATLFVACAGGSDRTMDIDKLNATADARLAIQLGPEPGDEQLSIDGTYVLILRDADGDGQNDHWTLRKNGREYVQRWSRSGHGSPDVLETFNTEGESQGIVASGHYREAEAEKYGLEMEKDIEKRQAESAASPAGQKD